jgi:putative Mn2+ efflux pump MntP
MATPDSPPVGATRTRFAWLGLAIAATLLGVAVLIFFALVPSNISYGLLLIPIVAFAFLVGGLAIGPPNRRRRGLVLGAVAYILVGVVVLLVFGGFEVFTNPEAVLVLLTWPLGIAVHFFGN